MQPHGSFLCNMGTDNDIINKHKNLIVRILSIFSGKGGVDLDWWKKNDEKKRNRFFHFFLKQFGSRT